MSDQQGRGGDPGSPLSQRLWAFWLHPGWLSEGTGILWTSQEVVAACVLKKLVSHGDCFPASFWCIPMEPVCSKRPKMEYFEDENFMFKKACLSFSSKYSLCLSIFSKTLKLSNKIQILFYAWEVPYFVTYHHWNEVGCVSNRNQGFRPSCYPRISQVVSP